MQLAFVGAQVRLFTAAAHHNERHDQHARGLPLSEGQLVYVRNLGLRGRWSSVVNTVLRAPREGGAVYTVGPTTDPHKVRYLHCCMLKGLVDPAVVSSSPSTAPRVDVPLPLDHETSSNEEFWGAQDVTAQPLLPGISVNCETPSCARGSRETSVALPSTVNLLGCPVACEWHK